MFPVRYFCAGFYPARYFVEASVTVVDPNYWRGASWVGHPKLAWPTDGALR